MEVLKILAYSTYEGRQGYFTIMDLRIIEIWMRPPPRNRKEQVKVRCAEESNSVGVGSESKRLTMKSPLNGHVCTNIHASLEPKPTT